MPRHTFETFKDRRLQATAFKPRVPPGRRTTAERVESTVELCRSDKSTGRYDSLKLESVRVASRLDAPGPGSCLVFGGL